MSAPLTNNRGVALLTTLLALVFVVIITLNFGDVIRRHLTGAAYSMTRIDLQERARSATDLALAVLHGDQQGNRHDSLHEPWAKEEALRQLTSQMFDDGALDLHIEDYSGRLQVNALISPQGGTVDAEQRNRFHRLLTTAEIGLSPDQADHILDALTDWLDEDDESNGFGAENSWYQTQDPPYPCKNGPISSLDELTLVRGITPELLYGSTTRPGLAQLLTPYGVDGKININTAPPLVLRTLSEGLDQALVDALLAYRADMGHDLAQPDWYKSVSPELNFARITVSSLYFGLRVKATLRNATIKALAVVLRQAPPDTPQGQLPPPFIISWQVE